MKKTVFILGAGSVEEYGFPISTDLTKYIINYYIDNYKKHTYPRPGWSRSDQWSNYSDSQIKSILRDESKNLKLFSEIEDEIDFVASRRSDLSEFSKKAIVLSIIELEKITKPRLSGGFYRELFTQLTKPYNTPDSISDIPLEDITFITFNYDRSLEYYFHRQANLFWGDDRKKEVSTLLKKLNVIHVYGKIANLDTFDLTDKFALPYGEVSSLRNSIALPILLDNISLIHEERLNNNSEAAIQKIKEAEIIYIFGFGYGSDNMNILKIPESFVNVKNIFGTALDESREVIAGIRSSLVLNIPGIDPKYNPTINDENCVRMIKDYPLRRYFYI